MKLKLIKMIAATALLLLAIPVQSFAGTWQSENGNWKYQNDDSTYATSIWMTIGGASYYFDSNSVMLKNTLSPDGFALGRDGKRIFYNGIIPYNYWGTEAEFDVFFNACMDYVNGYSNQFNSTFDEIFPSVIKYDKNKDFESARNSISRLDAFDFTSYMSSDNILISKMATADEIFRIEQVYNLSEILKTIEEQNYNFFSALLNKISMSTDKQFYDTSASLNCLRNWNNTYK